MNHWAAALVLLAGSAAWAADLPAPCEALHAAGDGTFERTFAAGNYQQALWAHRRAGDEPGAEKVAACLEAILTQGEIQDRDRLGGGISATFRVYLPGNVSAVFKPTNSFKGCYRHELAAYALDRRLGLDIVPMTIERTIDGQTGSLQVFIDAALPAHQAGAVRKNIELKLLDLLIDNEDRHAGNWLFYESDGGQHLVAIDHNLSFNCRSEARLSVVKLLQGTESEEAAHWAKRLAALPAEELERMLEPYVSRSRAIRKAVKTRARIIRYLNRLAAGK